MPYRNTLKVYVNNGFIISTIELKNELYLRIVGLQSVFKIHKEILSPNPENQNTTFYLRGQSYKAEKPLKNYQGEIDLLAYCLMPNHFTFTQTEK